MRSFIRIFMVVTLGSSFLICGCQDDNGGGTPKPPTADFEADKTTGPAPLVVKFTDKSTGDKKFYALNPDGTKKWDFTSDSFIYSSAAIGADVTIYFGTYGGMLYAIGK